MTFHIRLKQVGAGYLVDIATEDVKHTSTFAVASLEEVFPRLQRVMAALEECHVREESERFQVYNA